jgi:hypothetical protein
MWLLEHDDVADPDERRAKIESSCLIETAGEQWLQADDLDNSVIRIQGAGRALLSGLGFA